MLRHTSHATASERAPRTMAGHGARGQHVEPTHIPAPVLAIKRKRDEVRGQIAVLRHRHRKRKRLLKLLCQLTTQQLRAENRYERKRKS